MGIDRIQDYSSPYTKQYDPNPYSSQSHRVRREVWVGWARHANGWITR